MFGRTIVGAVSLSALALAALIASAPAQDAWAQLVPADPSNNSVLIDLGAIDGGTAVIGGSGRTGVGSMPAVGRGQLLLPPQSAPSSRLLGPDGRSLRAAAPPSPRAPERKAAASKSPKAAKAAKATPTRTASAPHAKPEQKAEPAKPALPPVALPSMPAATPTPPKDGGPIALNSPTPPPAVAPAPPPDIPAMQVVGPDAASKSATPGPQASVSPQATAPQPKAALAPQGQPQAKAPPASKGPTPAPAIAPAPPPDEPSAASPSPAAKSASKGEQQAALPSPRPAPGAPKGAEQGIEILFTAGTSDLSSDAKAALDKLAENMKGNEKSRLQLLAYAYEEQASPSKSRRLSLSRALAVRSHLISKGIRSTRIDVRALGDQVPGGEPNRVDLKITDR